MFGHGVQTRSNNAKIPARFDQLDPPPTSDGQGLHDVIKFIEPDFQIPSTQIDVVPPKMERPRNGELGILEIESYFIDSHLD